MPKCESCGAEIPEGATICPKCGAPARLPPPPPPIEGAVSRERMERHEKGEKHEKEEKHEDRFGVVVGGLILILLGIIMYLAQNRIIS